MERGSTCGERREPRVAKRNKKQNTHWTLGTQMKFLLTDHLPCAKRFAIAKKKSTKKNCKENNQAPEEPSCVPAAHVLGDK